MLSLLIDLERCVGCMACTVACKMENNLPVGNNNRQVSTIGPVGSFPDNLRLYYVPRGCMHCKEPICTVMCPTGANSAREDGLVITDTETCIACGMCAANCPYGALSVNQEKGAATKCELCRALTDRGQRPSCVKHCKAHALFFGSIDDSQSDIAQYLNQNNNNERAMHFLEGGGTQPTVVYLRPKCGIEDGEIEGLF